MHKVLVERYVLKPRKLSVIQKIALSKDMLRIVFQGGGLKDFKSRSPDDHVKLFFPDPSTSVLLEPVMLGGQGNKTNMQLARDYTPVWFDVKRGILEIDFFLHGKGLGSDWARHTKMGDIIFVGGPRASHVIPYDFDWYLMIGDETAIPAIERRLRELPYGSRMVVALEISDAANQRILIEEKKDVLIQWIMRDNLIAQNAKDPLIEFLNEYQFPVGDYYTWIALEATKARIIKNFMVETKKANPGWVKAAGYWKKMM